jgi:hypothetical protein
MKAVGSEERSIIELRQYPMKGVRACRAPLAERTVIASRLQPQP